ncbi:MAG TPA: NAD-dependent epimerase/dehydratase family protein [Thermoanaerobaculia bacterium]|nr:NAD-dependent epimerase/dehydratase family protein [Thermoanaerobaculia bacterium]
MTGSPSDDGRAPVRRILVLGGFGFLGSHLVEHLLAEPGNQVHVIDNLSSSPLPLPDLLAEIGDAERHGGRLTWSVESVDAYCGNGASAWAWDEIYHLASLVGPAGVLGHAGAIASSVIHDAARVAALALATGARLLFVSTSEVYGGGRDGLCSEEMPKLVPSGASPRLEYALGKLAAETSLVNLCRARGLAAVIVRPFNISGPRQSGAGGFVLPRFVGQALAGEDLTVFGDGLQVRAFTNVRDMAAGVVAALRRGHPGEIYNLGNPANRCSILDLAEEVREVTGSGSGIRMVDPRDIYGPLYAEAHDKFPDPAKAERELGWRPAATRRETVAETVAYMRRLPRPLLHRLRGF